MITVTKKAAALLKAAKAANGTGDAVIRIRKGLMPTDAELTVELSISDEPAPDDEEFEQEGIRIFVEDALVEPLDGRILDARYNDDDGAKPELVLR
jgi:Fe-S cluster assembly iron-binding protein IscA